MWRTIEYAGCELEVEFNISPAEPDVGLHEHLEIVCVLYKECDVWDVILAFDNEGLVEDKVWELL